MNEMTSLSAVSEVAGRFSAREFIRMKELGAFDGMKVELVKGEIIRMNPPNLSHGTKQAQILWQLFQAYDGVDVVIAGETGVRLSDETIRAFDAVVFKEAPSDMKLLDPGLVLLAVEISDTTLSQDRGPKAEGYAKAGIPVYWVIDVNGRCVHVYSEPDGGAYGECRTYSFAEDIMPPRGIKSVPVF